MQATQKFNQDRKFGVEIEMFGVSPSKIVQALSAAGISVYYQGYTHEVMNSWKIVPDGSLSGNYAVELVSPPLKGAAGLTEVETVMAVLVAAGGRVNNSCGFHVHHDSNDLTADAARGVLKLYAKFEAVIDNLVAPSRRNNTFCRSLRTGVEGTNQIEWIDSRLEGNSTQEVAYKFSGNSYHRNETRYRKVNLNCFFTYGTIEFRQHQGTLNGKKAVAWIIFTQRFIERGLQSKIRSTETAKLTLGELFRALMMCAHHTDDAFLNQARQYLKNRFDEFSA